MSINLKCRLSDQLEKTDLSDEERICVLTSVAVCNRVLAQEQSESNNPIAYDDMMERTAALLKPIGPFPGVH